MRISSLTAALGVAGVVALGAGVATPAEAAVPTGFTVYAGDLTAAAITTIDPASGAVDSIALPAVADSLVVSADGTHLYARAQGGQVYDVDTATRAVTTWETGAGWGMSSSGIALSKDGTKLAVAGGSVNGREDCVVVVVDTATGAVSQQYTAPKSRLTCQASSVAWSPDASTLYMTDKTGNQLVTFDAATGAVTAALNKWDNPDRLHNDPVSVALTGDGSTVLVAFDLPNFGSEPGVVALDATTLELKANYVPGSTGVATRGGAQLAVSPEGSAAYVASGQYAGYAFGIDTATNGTISGPWALGSGMTVDAGAAVSPDGSQAYFTIPGAAKLTVLDTASGDSHTIDLPAGRMPAGLAAAPAQAPTAALGDASGTTGEPVTLDASASSAVAGLAIASYAWEFGDGETATTTTPTVEHAYATAGSYTARVTVTDTAGTSTSVSYDGVRVLRHGGPTATTTGAVTVADPAPEPTAPATTDPTAPVTTDPTAPATTAPTGTGTTVPTLSAGTTGTSAPTAPHRVLASTGAQIAAGGIAVAALIAGTGLLLMRRRRDA